jgi:hypothetical protein
MLFFVRPLVRLLTSKNGIPFLASVAIGYLVATSLPLGWWTPYASILVAYHLFLGWLLLSADHETGVSLPIWATILTHLCCLLVLITFSKVSYAFPILRIIRLGAVYLATFEVGWLFSAAEKQLPDAGFVAAVAIKTRSGAGVPLVAATGADHHEWIKHRSQKNMAYYKPGTSPGEDFELWLRARGKTQYAAAAAEEAQPVSVPAQG